MTLARALLWTGALLLAYCVYEQLSFWLNRYGALWADWHKIILPCYSRALNISVSWPFNSVTLMLPSRRKAGKGALAGPRFVVPVLGCIVEMVLDPFGFWERQRECVAALFLGCL